MNLKAKFLAILVGTLFSTSASAGNPYAFNSSNSLDGTNYASNVDVRDYLMRSNQVALKSDAKEHNFDVWSRLRRGFVMNEVRSDLVEYWERYYSRDPAYFARMTKRARPFLYYIVQEVERRNMPTEVAILPFIESAFKPSAKSHVGAMGIWQFMPLTGTEYGLNQSQWFDSRNDFTRATQAALDYLQESYNRFGDWALAFAAYNAGNGKVNKEVNNAIARGQNPVFDNLRFVNETTNYVPKLLAVRNIIQNPERFGIKLDTIKNEPYFDTISLSQPMDMSAIAKLAGMSLDELTYLNAGHRVPVWVPRKERNLLLPIGKIDRFISNLQRANPEKLLSWQVWRLPENSRVADLARRTNMSVAEFKEINQIYGDTLPAGYTVLVSADADMNAPFNPVNNNGGFMNASYSQQNNNAYMVNPVGYSSVPKAQAPRSQARSANNQRRQAPATKTVTVKRGDNLFRIAKANGMTVAELKDLNGLRSNQINAGQRIRVRN